MRRRRTTYAIAALVTAVLAMAAYAIASDDEPSGTQGQSGERGVVENNYLDDGRLGDVDRQNDDGQHGDNDGPNDDAQNGDDDGQNDDGKHGDNDGPNDDAQLGPAGDEDQSGEHSDEGSGGQGQNE